MTPFAQLHFLEKVAAVTPPAPGYQVNDQSGLRDPYSTPVPASTGKPWGTVSNGWGNFALEALPVVSTAYLGNKAVQDFRYGNIGSGIGNSVMTAVSLIPGAGVVKGVGKGLLSGAGAAVKGGAKGMFTTGPLGGKGMAAGIGVGMAAPALDAVGSSEGPDYTKPSKPMNPWLRTGVMAVGGIPGFIGGTMNMIDEMRQPATAATHDYKTPTTPTLNPAGAAGSLHRAMTDSVVNNGLTPPTT